MTASRSATAREGRGRAQPHRDPAAGDRDVDVVLGPAGQRRARRLRRRAAGGERQRPGLGGAVGEGQRVAGGEQLQRDQRRQQQRRQRRDQLDRGLSALQPSPPLQARAARRPGPAAAPAAGAAPAPRPRPRRPLSTPAPRRSAGGSARRAAAAAPRADERRPRTGPRGDARRPERLAGERDLRRHQHRQQQEGHHRDQLDRGGPSSRWPALLSVGDGTSPPSQGRPHAWRALCANSVPTRAGTRGRASRRPRPGPLSERGLSCRCWPRPRCGRSRTPRPPAAGSRARCRRRCENILSAPATSSAIIPKAP